MTLINPFGVSRYLQPRRAGMIAFKGGTTTIKETGLRDDQYQTLQTNQAGIRSDIGGLGTNMQDYGDTLKTGQSNISDLIGTGSTGEDSPATGLYGQFSNQTGLLSGLGDRIDTGFTDLTNYVDTSTSALAEGQSGLVEGQSGLVSNIGDVQTSQNTGFADMGTRFDTVDTAGSNLQTAVDTGFQDTTNTLANTNANINTGFADASSALAAGIDDTKAKITSATDATNTQLGAARDDLVAGQSGLTNDLSTMSANQDIYATSLQDNQANLQSGQDAFVSNFDTYVDRYSDDVALANQFRTDLEKAQTNAFKSQKEQQLDQFNSLSKDVSNFNNANQSNADQLNQAVEKQTYDLNNIRGLLQNPNISLGTNIKSQYQKLTAAFDPQGNLVTQGLDAQGNTLRREFDAQGAVIESSFDQSGNQISVYRMDVGQMITNANDYLSVSQNGFLPGANTSMGNSSSAVSTNNGGLMAPYTQTG